MFKAIFNYSWSSNMIRVGVDVGGTNTDAVIMD